MASGYPYKKDLPTDINYQEDLEKSEIRATRLGSAKAGSGHDNFLKGIIVQFDITAPEYFWRQFDRYHFHDYVSSQSKMHCILEFDVDKMCNEYVDKRIVEILKEKIDIYNKMEHQDILKERKERCFQEVVSNIPMGLELTARITSNYLQEKSIYLQREFHKLNEWKIYREWQEQLPKFIEFIKNDKGR